MDLLLDARTHDLVIRDGDLQPARGLDLMRQRIKQSLLFFFGEWYLDVTQGIPYFTDILIKGPVRSHVESLFKATILGVPNVTELTNFELNYNNVARSLTVIFSCRTDIGDLTNVSVPITI
jgi:hypothetical protein